MPVLFAGLPIARLKTGGMRLYRQVRLRNLPFNNMEHEADTAFEPGEARVKDQIYKAGKRSYHDAALASVHALLGIRHCRIFFYRERGVQAAVFVPIAVVGMVIMMMSRPYVLRHARDDAEEKSESAIERLGAKQAAVAAFVHQRKDAQSEQDNSQHRDGGEPAGNVDAAQGDPPKEGKGGQRRQNLGQCFHIIGLGMLTNDGALVFLDVDDRRHATPPRLRVLYLWGAAGVEG